MSKNLIKSSLMVFLLLLLTACSGASDLPLPFTKGRGENDVKLVVELADSAGLVNNSEVKVDGVTVGSVRKITFADWKALVEIGIDPGVNLASTTRAQIGQKSLLGAQYLELATPKSGGTRLTSGGVIPLANTGTYPSTEDTLSGLSMLLNGGGLTNIKTITRELNLALSGRAKDVHNLVRNMNSFLTTIDQQRKELIKALQSLNRLSKTVVGQRGTIARAMKVLPKGFQVLIDERPTMMKLLRASNSFSTIARQVLDGSRANLAANLRDLTPALQQLANAGKALPGALGFATMPIAVEPALKMAQGDYVNIFMNIDLTMKSLDEAWLTGTPLEGAFGGQANGSKRLTARQQQMLRALQARMTAPSLPNTSASTAPGSDQQQSEQQRLASLFGGGQ